MESVAIDVFSMPEVHIGEEVFNCVVLCVEGHSGYIVAAPARKKGLLAKEVAVMMIRYWLTVFGIPRTICSDPGPEFSGALFKAMCSLMGVRHAKSIAYISCSNCWAELVGRQLLEKLRKIHLTNKRRNWFEEMWPVLNAHHDTPTPGGLPPHQVLFSRTPWVGDSPCKVRAWQWMPLVPCAARDYGAGDSPAAQRGARRASQDRPEVRSAKVQDW